MTPLHRHRCVPSVSRLQRSQQNHLLRFIPRRRCGASSGDWLCSDRGSGHIFRRFPRYSRKSCIAKSSEDSLNSEGRYPFHGEDFYQVEFVPKPYNIVRVKEYGYQGVITFMKKDDGPFPSSEKAAVLEVYVGGDVLESMLRLLHGMDERNNRPLPHDFLWTIISEVKKQHGNMWSLLKVAIVGIVDSVYLARAFFGDAKTGDVAWDVDCRPSDASWLAFKSGVPIYIKKSVWESDCKSFEQSYAYKFIQHQPYTIVDEPLPEEVQLMIKQLEVAIKEEDYPKAISLRDHPYMQLYNKIKKAEEENHVRAAQSLREELKGLVLKSRQQGGLGSD